MEGLIGVATVEKNGLMSNYSAASWVKSIGTTTDTSRIYRICKHSDVNVLELFGRYNGRTDEQYGFFRVFTFDKNVIAKLISGDNVCYSFYKDDTYLYVKVSGSNYIRSITWIKTVSLHNVFSDVTNSINESSLTKISLS